MTQIYNLNNLLIQRIILLHSANSQLFIFFNDFKINIHSNYLRQLINDNNEKCRLHSEGLHLVLGEFGETLVSGENLVITSLISELQTSLRKCTEVEVCDAAFIGFVQNIIHYMISGYGTCCSYAKTLGMQDVAKLFYNMVQGEKKLDVQLSRLAEDNINERAKSPLIL